MEITKNRYLSAFAIIVVILALVRCIYPDVAKKDASTGLAAEGPMNAQSQVDTIAGFHAQVKLGRLTQFFDANGKEIKNGIYSVPRFSVTFPDSNDVQIASAKRYGVSPVENRQDAEQRKKELVFIGANPFYEVDPLKNSIPYLVPQAAILLNDIGRNFYDSLQIKQITLHKFIVTSALRTKEDVEKLRNRNHNATANSCHLYGTTFDICYNRYSSLNDINGKPQREVRNDTLKWVLSEVLRDMRETNRCYIKYEVKQGCFHITVR